MAAADFDHFLLTRFNVRIDERAPEEWLRHRLGYFERICRASVMNQTNHNFRWLVLFDAERDQWFQDEVDRLSAGVFEPVWIDGPLSPEISANILAERATAPWVISSRLDNDDALARDYIESVQAEFNRQDAEFVNFTAGLQLSDDGALYHRSDPSNAFLSLIEKRMDKPLIGVFVDWHDRVSKHAPVRQVSTHPMWLQMVHGRNIGNAIRGIRADHTLLAKHFDVDATASPISRGKLLASQVASTASLAWRVIRKPSRVLWALQVVRAKLAKVSK